MQRYLRVYLLALGSGMAAAFLLGFWLIGLHYAAPTAQAAPVAQLELAECAPGDLNCDGLYNVLDLQLLARDLGQPALMNDPRDLNGDGVIDAQDLAILRAGWRLSPGTLMGGLPRLGYAVNDDGHVFLRWALPISPYEAPVEILRQPAPAGAPLVRPDVGVVEMVQPLYDDATALPLIGDEHWPLVRTAFSSTVDAEGEAVAVELATVAEVQALAQAGANPTFVNTLSNQHAGVARVFGKGYFDMDTNPGTVYTYWVRVNGRLVGPVSVRTDRRTRLPAPTDVDAFVGDVNVPSAAEVGDVVRLRMLRGAHASAFVTWNPDLNRRESSPVWHQGFNVFRQVCDLDRTNCSAFTQVNDLPVLPREVADDALEPYTTENGALEWGERVSDFAWYWVDRELDTGRLYCYQVAALDLLQQDGALSDRTGEACLQPPDFLPPEAPEMTGVETIYKGPGVVADIKISWVMPDDAERNGDLLEYKVYRSTTATAAWPDGWSVVDTVRPNAWHIPADALDRNLAEHTQYWYRVVAMDRDGNMSVPSAPALGKVDDIYPPDTPLLNCGQFPNGCIPHGVVMPADTAYVRIYRSFTEDGIPLLVDRIPAGEWINWQDPYVPGYEIEVFYWITAEDAAGNLSEPTAPFGATLGVIQLSPLSTPIITGATWSKVSNFNYEVEIQWTAAAGGGLQEYRVYRSQGSNPPETVAEMTEVHVMPVALGYFGGGERSYAYVDDTLGLQANELYWYVIVAKGLGTNAATSKPFATRFMVLGDEPERDIRQWGGGAFLELNPDDSIKGVSIGAGSQDGCCWLFLRSDSPNGGFTQISPILDVPSYFDTEVFRGMGTVYYQALQIDAGRGHAPNIDFDHISGEILATTDVFAVTLPDLPIPANNPEAPIGPFVPAPAHLPTHLRFGTEWLVRVLNYDAGSQLGAMSGEGEVELTLAPGGAAGRERVRVRFDGVEGDTPDGNRRSQVLGINTGGEARVMIGTTLTPQFPNRMVTALSNLLLDENGAKADALFLGYGEGLNLWYVDGPGVGFPFPLPLANLELRNPALEWTRVVTPPQGQNCTQPLSTSDFPFAVSGWPLFVVPTDVFTVTETGISFSNTCTAYRERYSGYTSAQNTTPAVEIDYRNDYFLKSIYTGSAAHYTVAGGLNGSWISTGSHTYSAVVPYGFQLQSNSRQFALNNGRMSSGSMDNGTLSFAYATEVDTSQTAAFSGSFSNLTIGANGAIYGTVTGDNVNWTALTIDLPDYQLYLPAAQTPRAPVQSWTASRGTEAAGVPGSDKIQSGLNAGDRDLAWHVCPASAVSTARFVDNANSRVDLYVRRGGVSGRADLSPTVPVLAKVAGYDTEFTRFAMSWLDNLAAESGVAGKFILPYPADIELAFDALWLDANGCVDSGAVIPQPQVLEYWQVPVIPRFVEIRPSTLSHLDLHFCRICHLLVVNRLWLLGEYEISNLTQAEGPASNQIEVDIAFNPNGTFHDANVFPAQTVYLVDDFYVILNDLRLSGYNADNPAASEQPAWDTTITTEQPPAEFTGGAPTGNAGFVELTAGIYFPLFGEATDPNSAHIYLLGQRSYIGFDQRPVPESVMSQALDVTLAYQMAYAQGSGSTPSRWVGMATASSRAISPKGETLFTTPHGLIVEPDSARVLFGFPTAAALFIAANEAYISWPERSNTNLINRFEGWRGKLLMTDAAFDGNPRLASNFINDGFTNYKTLIASINNAVAPLNGEVDRWITDTRLDNVHIAAPMLTGILANSPLQLQWLRGDAAISAVRVGGVVSDGKLDRLLVAAHVRVFEREQSGSGSESPLLKGQMLMDIDPQGSIYLGAERVAGSVLARSVEFDADMRILFSVTLGYGLEGGLTLYGLETEVATINKAGAVAGFTLIKGPPSSIGLMYMGVTLDLKINMPTIGNVTVGGSMLMGRLDPNSPVLEQEYGDLFRDMKAGNNIIEGAYLLVYANDIPIYNVGAGCLGISISGGGEVAFWVFTEVGSSDTAWGTRVGVNAMGKAFCVAAAKADIKLTLENNFGQNGLDLKGAAWAGAGCGACEPETWKTKSDVLNDKWCLKCIIDLNFLIPLKGSSSKADLSFSAACPF